MHVVEWLRLNARKYPSRTAYVVEDDLRTWGEIDARSDALASQLQALGVRAGARVAYLGTCGFEAIEWWYGIVKAGGLYVGLNPRLGAAELARQLEDCDPVLFAFDAEHAGTARAVCDRAGAAVATVGYGEGHGAELDYEQLLERGAAGTVEHTPTWDQDLALFYTSGSSGDPKAVVCSNDRLVHTLYNTLLLWGFRPDDVYLHNGGTANLAIMFATWNSVLAIPTVLLPRFDPFDELRQIERHRVTVFANVVTMLERLLEDPRLGDFDLSSLRLVNYGSMPASPTLAVRARAALGCDLLQLYGMTEGLGFFSCLTPEDHRRALASPSDAGILRSAGRTFPHTDVRILDPVGSEVAFGQTGEICVRTPAVSKGYWNRPEATAARFRAGWLHTGDMGHLDEDGYLYVTDRQDAMIITGGFNVFPAQVERVLGMHPDVTELCVVGVPSETWGQEVQAFVRVRARDGEPPEVVQRRVEAELDVLCREQLARHQAPKRLHFVEALPYGPTGKIRRQELQEWASRGSGS